MRYMALNLVYHVCVSWQPVELLVVFSYQDIWADLCYFITFHRNFKIYKTRFVGWHILPYSTVQTTILEIFRLLRKASLRHLICDENIDREMFSYTIYSEDQKCRIETRCLTTETLLVVHARIKNLSFLSEFCGKTKRSEHSLSQVIVLHTSFSLNVSRISTIA